MTMRESNAFFNIDEFFYFFLTTQIISGEILNTFKIGNNGKDITLKNNLNLLTL